MVETDLELDRDLGEATIVYEDPEEGTVDMTVPNEHIAYFQDHWIVKTNEDDEGHDIVRRIPSRRVHYVERSVEEFEEEVQTVKRQVQSFAEDLRSRLPVGGGGDEGREDSALHDSGDVHPIDVDIEEPDDRD